MAALDNIEGPLMDYLEKENKLQLALPLHGGHSRGEHSLHGRCGQLAVDTVATI